MGERAIENRIKKLKALEEQKKELEAQISGLQEEIKKDMEAKGIEEMQAGIFIIFLNQKSRLCRYLHHPVYQRSFQPV